MKVDYFSYVSLSYLQRDGRLERASGRLWVLSATLSQLSLLLHLPFFSPPPLPPPPLPLPFFFCLPTYFSVDLFFLSFFAAVYLPTYQHTCKTFAARLPLSLSLSLTLSALRHSLLSPHPFVCLFFCQSVGLACLPCTKQTSLYPTRFVVGFLLPSSSSMQRIQRAFARFEIALSIGNGKLQTAAPSDSGNGRKGKKKEKRRVKKGSQ
ncbi:hypothetical protein BKA81DRAFT_117965 [Phyllosticta paracitricarpa]|uniref:Transmembrane protein n=1 Tax=Phyllosticta paracitricarpa TaxID=2016321 RepID=A0ABR1MXT3_9PEZI